MNNLPQKIQDYLNRREDNKYHRQLLGHPIAYVTTELLSLFMDYEHFCELSPIVTVEQNFDSLLIEKDHPSRSKSDTYYMDDNKVLRTQTSCHQVDLLREGHSKFIVAGDVYRRDSIDSSHYPIFHQMEGVKLCENPMEDLEKTLKSICKCLFPKLRYRFEDAYFPFTKPSLEVSVLKDGDWMEVLGAGQIHPGVLENAGLDNTTKGWAFGLGLERLAMLKYDIPDIRLFWSEDERFKKQFLFKQGDFKFKPYSSYPPCYKDIAFWINDEFEENDLYELIRKCAGDLVEEVQMIDEFISPETQKHSKCFRVTYRSWDRTLTDDEINVVQDKIRENVANELNVILR